MRARCINTTFLIFVGYRVIALLAQLLFLFIHNLLVRAYCCFSFSHCTMVLHTLHKTIVNTAHVTVLRTTLDVKSLRGCIQNNFRGKENWVTSKTLN